MTKPSAKDFREPLLLTLGEMSNWTSDVPVHHESVTPPILTKMGIDGVDQYGRQDASGKPWIVLWISWAFRALKDSGEAIQIGRGQWGLTSVGVNAAMGLARSKGQFVPDAVIISPVAPKDMFTTLIKPEYHPDPYIRQVALNQTRCVGHWSDRSSVCGKCRLEADCKQVMFAKLTELAKCLDAGTTLPPQETDKNPSPLNPALSFTHQGRWTLVTFADGSTKVCKGKDMLRIPITVESKCEHCNQIIPIGSNGYWTPRAGVFHEDCIWERATHA